jgi:hypothetical protein
MLAAAAAAARLPATQVPVLFSCLLPLLEKVIYEELHKWGATSGGFKLSQQQCQSTCNMRPQCGIS